MVWDCAEKSLFSPINHNPISPTPCPLCEQSSTAEFFRDKKRSYHQCSHCSLIFVPKQYFLSPKAEKAEYDLHENHPEDLAYRKFLSRLTDPLIARIDPNSSGLDFGSGPGPTLSRILEASLHTMTLYDHFYATKTDVLDGQYDFITATEVLEHFFTPRQTLSQILHCLKPGGWLGIMTKLSTGQVDFPTWHYKNDPTHVAFYSRETFDWIGNHWQLEVEIIGKDVVLLRKGKAG